MQITTALILFVIKLTRTVMQTLGIVVGDKKNRTPGQKPPILSEENAHSKEVEIAKVNILIINRLKPCAQIGSQGISCHKQQAWHHAQP